jgi:ferrous iron transport protein B
MTRRAALLGNPNTGKTTLFNALTGLSHRVGNYPGVTVESKSGKMSCGGEEWGLIDLPGTYSLAPRSPDEMVAVDVVLGRMPGEPRPDVLVCIADAANLDRNLYLTTQALDLGLPVVVALNMIDLAEAQGLKINVPLLSEKLGLPVVPIQANTKKGLDALRQAIAAAAGSPAPSRRPAFPQAFEDEVAALRRQAPETPEPLLRRLLLDVGGYTEKVLPGFPVDEARKRLAEAGCPVPAIEARTRYAWIREATSAAVQRPEARPASWTDTLDALLTHRLWGALSFLAVMLVLFLSIFTAARPLMKAIDFGKEALAGGVKAALPPGPFTSLLADGVIAGVGAVVVFLPQILILFAILAFLEDCGYMARAAFLMDRVMSRCGLSGKSFIPLLSSLACAVPGILATRVIEDRRDRLVTILVAPLMSCSARLPVYTLMIGAFLTTGYSWWVPGVTMFCMYALGLVAAPLVALALKKTLLPGEAPVFVLEMPAYKWPTLYGVARRVWDAAYEFLARAGTVILAAMIVVWALLYFPSGGYPERVAAEEARFPEERQARAELEGEVARAERLARDAQKRAESGSLGSEDLRVIASELEEARALLAARLEALDAVIGPADEEANRLLLEWKEQSILGRLGHFLEPVVRPLGWDWRMGVAALASFPAREVVVGTLGILYRQGKVDTEEVLGSSYEELAEKGLGAEMRRSGLTAAAALSLMVFFALCAQCASTLAVIRRETNSWAWPVFTFVYMTGLAYVAALVVYQAASRLGG